MAFSKSPSLSTNALRQSIIPAPVVWRSLLISAAVIVAVDICLFYSFFINRWACGPSCPLMSGRLRRPTSRPGPSARSRATRSRVRDTAFGLAGASHFLPAAAGCFVLGLCLEAGSLLFVLVRCRIFNILFFRRLSFGQAFGDGSGHIVDDDGDRLCGVVIGGDGEVHLIGIAVGVDHAKSGDAEAFGFCQCDMFVADIDDEQGSGDASEL